MGRIYLARQPIVDKQEKIFAYELLYRDSEEKKQDNEIANGRHASIAVITNVLNKFGTKQLLGKRKAFVKVDEKFLMSDMIFSVPKEFFVFSLLDSIVMHARHMQRIAQLYKDGFELCLNDTEFSFRNFKRFEPILKCFSYVKMNITEYPTYIEAKKLITLLKENKIKVIGTRIEEIVQRDKSITLGCEFFQGYYFAKPKIVENKKFEPNQFAVMKLYRLLMQDEDIEVIAEEFEKNHGIMIQLLRFINSSIFPFRNRISSIQHLMVLVGRKPLAQWLMLMIYSKSVSKTNDFAPLTLLIRSRTELMESILKAIRPNVSEELVSEAYFVGVLSLIDTIFEMPLPTVLKHLSVSEEIEDAILNDFGILGEIYALIRSIEVFDTKAVQEFSVKYEITEEKINDLVVESIENVNKFESGMLKE